MLEEICREIGDATIYDSCCDFTGSPGLEVFVSVLLAKHNLKRT
jgi:hypothetical protein